MKDTEYMEYIESGRWRCPNAPINTEIPLQVENNCGAHYWVEMWLGGKVGNIFLCRYCCDVKKITRWNSWGRGTEHQISSCYL